MPIPDTAQALTRALAREDVYVIVKRWIVDLQLAPGEVIRDQELAASLGVSRTPVREALRRLEDEGLVVTQSHKWTRVAPTEIAEAEQLYPVVAALEAAAIELALPRIVKADLTRLGSINKAMAGAISRGDAQEAATQDEAFHALIVEKSGNVEIAKLLGTLLPRIRRIELAHFGNQMIAHQSVREHDAIVAALRKGDSRLAAETMRKNWAMSPPSELTPAR